jgi:hypothetical protein
LTTSPDIPQKITPKPTPAQKTKRISAGSELISVPESTSPPPVRITRSRTQAIPVPSSPRMTRSRSKTKPSEVSALPKPNVNGRKTTRKTRIEDILDTEETIYNGDLAQESVSIGDAPLDQISKKVDNVFGLRQMNSTASTNSHSPVRLASAQKLIVQESMIFIRESSFGSITTDSLDEHLLSPKEKARSSSQVPLTDIETLSYEIHVPKSPAAEKKKRLDNNDVSSKLQSPKKMAPISVTENFERLGCEKVSLKPLQDQKELFQEQVSSNFNHRKLLIQQESISELDDGASLEEVRMLKLELKNLRENNDAFLNQQLNHQQELQLSLQVEQDLRLEIRELNGIIHDSNRETLQQSYNMLISKYENSRNEVSNLQIQIDKLKTNIKKLSGENRKLTADLDEKNDALEMALIDKCISEEQMDIQKQKEAELTERIEELLLELDLAQEHHFEPSQLRRKDLLDQDRLIDA